MSKRDITNCGDCAYVQKGSNGMWCPFHDEPVSNNVVCNDFLDYFDSPQMSSLIDGMNDERDSKRKSEEKKIPQFNSKDIIALILTGLCIAAGIAVVLYFGLMV